MSKITSAMAALGVVAGLGVAALPLATYAAESNQVTIRALVDSSIAVSTNNVDLVDFGSISAGDGETIQTIDITVTGSVNKYNLGVMDYDNDTNMNWVDQAGTTAADTTNGTPSKIIPTVAGETLSGGWGFRLENRHVTPNAWKEMPAYNADGAAINLVDGGVLNGKVNEGTDEEATVAGEVTSTVQFGINIDGLNLENGRYEDKVVFVATPQA